MTLREQLLDAVIDGKIGKGIVVTRKEFLEYFKDENPNTTGPFLANSEMKAKEKYGSNNKPFVLRVIDGEYRIHPSAIEERMSEREILKATG